MDQKALEDALMRVIRIQQQMITEFAYMRGNVNAAVRVMSGLDDVFERAYFAQILAYDPENLPGSLPTRQELSEALSSLGWTPDRTIDLDFWTTCHRDPWEDIPTRKTIKTGLPSRGMKR